MLILTIPTIFLTAFGQQITRREKRGEKKERTQVILCYKMPVTGNPAVTHPHAKQHPDCKMLCPEKDGSNGNGSRSPTAWEQAAGIWECPAHYTQLRRLAGRYSGQPTFWQKAEHKTSPSLVFSGIHYWHLMRSATPNFSLSCRSTEVLFFVVPAFCFALKISVFYPEQKSRLPALLLHQCQERLLPYDTYHPYGKDSKQHPLTELSVITLQF